MNFKAEEVFPEGDPRRNTKGPTTCVYSADVAIQGLVVDAEYNAYCTAYVCEHCDNTHLVIRIKHEDGELMGMRLTMAPADAEIFAEQISNPRPRKPRQ